MPRAALLVLTVPDNRRLARTAAVSLHPHNKRWTTTLQIGTKARQRQGRMSRQREGRARSCSPYLLRGWVRREPSAGTIFGFLAGKASVQAGRPGTSNATREPCARRVGKPPQRTQKVAVRRSVISAKSTRGYGFTTTRREGGRERRRRNDKTHTTRAARHGQPQRTPPARLHRRRRLTHTEKKTQLGTNCPKLAAMVHGHTLH